MLCDLRFVAAEAVMTTVFSKRGLIWCAASILLARESTLAVKAVNEEMDHRHLSS